MTNESSGPRYTAPPIIEAIIQVAYAEPYNESDFKRLSKRLKKRYANETLSSFVNAKIEFQERSATFEEAPQSRLSSADEADVLVILPNALTWSRLAPYEGWEPLIARVSSELADAVDAIGYRKVTRLGVRYVNRISVPVPDDNITRYEDYLNINIDIPKVWPTIENYAWRFEKSFGAYLAIVQSAIIEPEIPNTAAFLLDIDVIHGLAPNIEVPQRVDGILHELEQMRVVKNNVFEVSVSDLAKDSFQI